jgi:transposase-like protein
VNEKKPRRVYDQEFKHRAVEMVARCGKPKREVSRANWELVTIA